jgi:isocitrate dehydrogenase
LEKQLQQANIIKLPNISASVPQLKEAIAELQSHGYNILISRRRKTEEEKQANCTKALGSAVNLLRTKETQTVEPRAVKKLC